jgi:hypothetical protein
MFAIVSGTDHDGLTTITVDGELDLSAVAELDDTISKVWPTRTRRGSS